MKIIDVRLMQNYILADIVGADKTKGGLIIPDTAKKPNADLVVVNISKEVDEKGEPYVKRVQIGDIILLDPHIAQAFKLDGKDHILLRENDVIAILPPSEPDIETNLAIVN
jgi:chaperonin GroES